MELKVITLKFDERLGGFPEQPLRQVTGSGSIVEYQQHFYVHAGVPYLTFVLAVDEAGSRQRKSSRGPDPGRELPGHLQSLYRSLRRWRNERAKQEGVPSYVLFRNVQAAEICRRLPRSIAELRQIDGIGEETCRKYGKDILQLIPEELGKDEAREKDAPQGEEKTDNGRNQSEADA